MLLLNDGIIDVPFTREELIDLKSLINNMAIDNNKHEPARRALNRLIDYADDATPERQECVHADQPDPRD